MEMRSTRFTATLEQWQAELGLSHQDFMAFLGGRGADEWAHYRAGRRDPSESFVRAARRKARAVAPEWLARLDAAYQEDALLRVS